MFLSIPKTQTLIHYLGIPYIVELSHYNFYAVMDMDGNNQIENVKMEGKILNKYFKLNK